MGSFSNSSKILKYLSDDKPFLQNIATSMSDVLLNLLSSIEPKNITKQSLFTMLSMASAINLI